MEPTLRDGQEVGTSGSGRRVRPLSFCATHELISLIGDRWSVLVLCQLGDHGEMRSAVLKRAVEGVSQKVLTSCLRRLEERGFVARVVDATVPATVSYKVTPFGSSFFTVFQVMRQWADEHADQIDRAPGRGTVADIRRSVVEECPLDGDATATEEVAGAFPAPERGRS